MPNSWGQNEVLTCFNPGAIFLRVGTKRPDRGWSLRDFLRDSHHLNCPDQHAESLLDSSSRLSCPPLTFSYIEAESLDIFPRGMVSLVMAPLLRQRQSGQTSPLQTDIFTENTTIVLPILITTNSSNRSNRSSL